LGINDGDEGKTILALILMFIRLTLGCRYSLKAQALLCADPNNNQEIALAVNA
jgi:hypothetical protein